MAFTDYFTKEGKVKRLGKRLTEKFGPPENRQKAIAVLAEMGTPEALSALLLRFTINSDSRITDAEEKQAVFDHLVAAGETSIEPLRSFIREKNSVSWAMRALAEIVSPQELLDMVLKELERLSNEYSRDPEKKVQLLNWLTEQHVAVDPRLGAVAQAFLGDMSDDVKIAALAVLLQQRDPQIREPLLRALVDEDQSARVRKEIIAAVADLSVGVQGYREKVEALVQEPYFVDKSGLIKKRGAS
jgi:HEAT repeat protein